LRVWFFGVAPNTNLKLRHLSPSLVTVRMMGGVRTVRRPSFRELPYTLLNYTMSERFLIVQRSVT
jgi:hypothetical protein